MPPDRFLKLGTESNFLDSKSPQFFSLFFSLRDPQSMPLVTADLQEGVADYPRPTVCSCAGGRSPASPTSSSRGPSSSTPDSSGRKTPTTSMKFVSSPSGTYHRSIIMLCVELVLDRPNTRTLFREGVQQRRLQIRR